MWWSLLMLLQVSFRIIVPIELEQTVTLSASVSCLWTPIPVPPCGWHVDKGASWAGPWRCIIRRHHHPINPHVSAQTDASPRLCLDSLCHLWHTQRVDRPMASVLQLLATIVERLKL